MKIIKIGSGYKHHVDSIKRRAGWFTYGLNVRKLFNGTVALCSYITSSEKIYSYPVFVKIDISPLCNLRCNACVHADPAACNDNIMRGLLNKQVYNPSMKMSYSDFCALIDKIKKYVSTVSLNWLGDPLMHEDLIKMIEYAAEQKIGVHITTNFSFRLSQEYVESLVNSGLTHLTVAIDGMSQETYSKTRINGRIELVKSNIENVCSYIKTKKLKRPIIELQYLLYDHNKIEYNDFVSWAIENGVEHVAASGGILNSNFVMYTYHEKEQYFGKNKKVIPYCYWPYFFMVINYNGDVFPCCQYRYDMINDNCSSATKIRCGNIFRDDFWDVWNSDMYKKARRLVKNPSAANKSQCNYFCYGCHLLYDIK